MLVYLLSRITAGALSGPTSLLGVYPSLQAAAQAVHPDGSPDDWQPRSPAARGPAVGAWVNGPHQIEEHAVAGEGAVTLTAAWTGDDDIPARTNPRLGPVAGDAELAALASVPRIRAWLDAVTGPDIVVHIGSAPHTPMVESLLGGQLTVPMPSHLLAYLVYGIQTANG